MNTKLTIYSYNGNDCLTIYLSTSSFAKKKPVDFDDELKIGDVRYDNMTNITIKQQTTLLTFTI